MASSKNLIQSLRSAHDPHFKLEGRVGELEKGLGVQVSQLHKTLSKSFAMQRKTLVRVLGLEGRVTVLESQKEVIEDVIEDELNADIPTEALETPAVEEELGGDEPSKGVSTLIDPPKTINAKRKIIKADDIKKGTPLSNDFKSRVMGEDEKGGYLTKEERIAKFKGRKIDPESIKPEDEVSSSEEKTSGGDNKSDNILRTIGGPISTIADTVDSIFNTLKEQFDEQKDTKEDNRIKQEQVDAKKDEKSLEKGGLKKGLEKESKKVLAPFQSIWNKFVNFLTTILFGKVVMKLLDWFGNPENAEKVKSFVRFLRDWWPVLLAGIMKFLPFVLGPGGMIIGTVVLIAWAYPKIVDAVKFIAKLPSMIGKFLTGGGKELDQAEKDAEKDIGKEEKVDPLDQAKAEKGEMGRPSDTFIDKKEEPVKMNKGGEVKGEEGVDKVPAMLTAGEFVMTKGAVEKYGVDTLEGLNAAAGGTNKPTLMKQYNEGGTATSMSQEEFVAAAMPGMQMFMEQQNAAVDENPEAYNGIKLELDRDGKMPNFGEFVYNQGEAEFNKGLEMIRNNEAVPPEIKEALIKKALFVKRQTLDDPNFKGEVAFDINKDIPGTAANRLFLRAQADTTSPAAMAGLSARDRALAMNRRRMNRGGLVQAFQGGGQVQRVQMGRGAAKRRMEANKIKPIKKKKVIVAYAEEKDNMADKPNMEKSSQEIPSFSVTAMRSSQKIKVLGVSV